MVASWVLKHMDLGQVLGLALAWHKQQAPELALARHKQQVLEHTRALVLQRMRLEPVFNQANGTHGTAHLLVDR